MYVVRHKRVRFITGTGSHRVVRTVDADLMSFETLSAEWATDRVRVFFRGEVVPDLSPSDLRCSHGLIKTESEIFFDTEAMCFDPPVDVRSFRPLGGPFFRDDDALYCRWYSWDAFSCDRIEADAATFEFLSGCFARDARGLFSHVHRVPEVHAPTFTVFHSQFARDESHVYLLHPGDKHTETTTLSVVAGADPDSFEVFDAHHAREQNAVYFFDDCGSVAAERHLLVECVRVDTPHPEAFVPLSNAEGAIEPDGYDGAHLFLRGRRLDLSSEAFRTTTTTGGGVHLAYVDLDRVSALVGADFGRFFPTATSPDTVDPDSLGPVDFDGAFRRSRAQASQPVVVGAVDSDDIPF